MFSFGPIFQELWGEIPTVKNYEEYCKMANAIDDASVNRDITARDESTLLMALDLIKVARGIKAEGGEVDV